MNKFSYLVRTALAATCIVLGLTQCNSNQAGAPASAAPVNGQAAALNVAYINIDSLLLKYDYAKDLNETILKKQENSRMNINEKGKALEKEVADFQRKVQSNAFLSEQRAQQEAQRLQKQEAQLNELQQRLGNELMIEQNKLNAQLNDTILSFLKDFNSKKGYEIIFSNTTGGNILVAQPQYDITNEVLDALNKRYAASKK